MKWFAAISLCATGLVLALVLVSLPAFGDPYSAPATHVSDYYIQHGYHDAHTPNLVTVIIADYRGFDTLGETMVVLSAGIACMLLLRILRPSPITRILRRKDSVIVDVGTRAMVPIIQIFAFYVIFHGHYSPGGGFQGGALLAGSILLQRITLGRDRSESVFPSKLGTPFGVVGIFVFGGVGLAALLFGGHFLQYDHLPFGLSPDMLRNWGILIAEMGVAFAVMGTLTSIFDDLSTAAEEGEGSR